MIKGVRKRGKGLNPRYSVGGTGRKKMQKGHSEIGGDGSKKNEIMRGGGGKPMRVFLAGAAKKDCSGRIPRGKSDKGKSKGGQEREGRRKGGPSLETPLFILAVLNITFILKKGFYWNDQKTEKGKEKKNWDMRRGFGGGLERGQGLLYRQNGGLGG